MKKIDRRLSTGVLLVASAILLVVVLGVAAPAFSGGACWR